jgi:hypothetical protein
MNKLIKIIGNLLTLSKNMCILYTVTLCCKATLNRKDELGAGERNGKQGKRHRKIFGGYKHNKEPFNKGG